MKYYLWIPDLVDQLIEDDDGLISTATKIDFDCLFDGEILSPTRNIAFAFLKTEAAKRDGYFGQYKLCPRHGVHDHPNSGCELCQEEQLGGNYVKQRRSRFDDED